MSEYRRYRIAGGTYFFTVVTQHRRPIFSWDWARDILQEALISVQKNRPFELLATVLLPDHMHCVWQLPVGDHAYSLRWAQIKETFTRCYLAAGGPESFRSLSRQSHHERAVWQRRFWEHTVTDENDLKRCVDHIHWNPFKHKLVQRVNDWKFSSFHRFVARGDYESGWGSTNPCEGYEAPEWE